MSALVGNGLLPQREFLERHRVKPSAGDRRATSAFRKTCRSGAIFARARYASEAAAGRSGRRRPEHGQEQTLDIGIVSDSIDKLCGLSLKALSPRSSPPEPGEYDNLSNPQKAVSISLSELKFGLDLLICMPTLGGRDAPLIL
jgi:hypothetical protein